MGHSEHDPAVKDRRPWNAGRKLGAKWALKPQRVWAVRFWLDREWRVRDRALFDLAIDSKPRGCDVVTSHDDRTHTIFVGRVGAAHQAGGSPLLYCDGRFSTLA